MGINSVNVLTLSNDRIELFDFMTKGNLLNLKEAFNLPIKDILDVAEDELTPLVEIGVKGKYFILTDCSYESLKNTFVLNKDVGDVRNKTINIFKDKYGIKLTDYYIDLRVQNFENYVVSYVVASPKSYVDTIGRFLKKKGGRLLCMESDIDSLKRFQPVKNTVYLHIHLNNRNSLALISRDGKILSERLITFGYKELLEILSRSGGISSEDARQILWSKGILEGNLESEEEINYQNSVINAMDRIGVEIQKSLDLFWQNIKDKMPEVIVVSGKIQNIPGLERYYSKLFNTEVRRFNILSLVESEMGEEVFDDFENLEVAAGAAMRRRF